MTFLAALRAGQLGPMTPMRGMLMDLGFAGLIEKIEERFGKGVTGALLLALVILVFAWTVSTIISLYVSGIKLWAESGSGAIIGLVKIGLVHLILIVVSSAIVYAIFLRMRDRAIRRVRDHGAKVADDIKNVGAEQISSIHAVAGLYGVELKGGETAEEQD